MSRIFICYNRDEMETIRFKGNRSFQEIINEKIEASNDNFYFDYKEFLHLNKEISKKIKDYLHNNDATLLLISDSTVLHGWTEFEVVEAIKAKREIRVMNIGTFNKIFVEKNDKMTLTTIKKNSKKAKI